MTKIVISKKTIVIVLLVTLFLALCITSYFVYSYIVDKNKKNEDTTQTQQKEEVVIPQESINTETKVYAPKLRLMTRTAVYDDKTETNKEVFSLINIEDNTQRQIDEVIHDQKNRRNVKFEYIDGKLYRFKSELATKVVKVEDIEQSYDSDTSGTLDISLYDIENNTFKSIYNSPTDMSFQEIIKIDKDNGVYLQLSSITSGYEYQTCTDSKFMYFDGENTTQVSDIFTVGEGCPSILGMNKKDIVMYNEMAIGGSDTQNQITILTKNIEGIYKKQMQVTTSQFKKPETDSEFRYMYVFNTNLNTRSAYILAVFGTEIEIDLGQLINYDNIQISKVDIASRKLILQKSYTIKEDESFEDIDGNIVIYQPTTVKTYNPITGAEKVQKIEDEDNNIGENIVTPFESYNINNIKYDVYIDYGYLPNSERSIIAVEVKEGDKLVWNHDYISVDQLEVINFFRL